MTLYAGVAVAALAAGWGCRSVAGAASRSRADNRSVRSGDLPTRPEQAPLVTIREIVDGEISLGRRVRVTGRCIAAGSGRSAGLWTLSEAGALIEVRGLVPRGCPSSPAEPLTIFAQVEWRRPGDPERLLLRLPGQ